MDITERIDTFLLMERETPEERATRRATKKCAECGNPLQPEEIVSGEKDYCSKCVASKFGKNPTTVKRDRLKRKYGGAW